MNILGIATGENELAVCLVRDGAVVAAISEEQVPGENNAWTTSSRTISSCLRKAGIDCGDLDCVAFGGRPLRQLERILRTCLAFAPSGFGSFRAEVSRWMEQKFRIRKQLKRAIGFQGHIIFPEYHEALAAAAFFPSPYSEAAFLTVDGAVEWASASYGLAGEERFAVLADTRYPHSLGLLGAAFAEYLGFGADFHGAAFREAASGGVPKYKKQILSELMALKEDGSFRLNMGCFEYRAGRLVSGGRFAELFGRPSQTADASWTALDKDLACSFRAAVEEILFRMVEHVYAQTGQRKLCLCGGMFRNFADRGRFERESSFENVWIQSEIGEAATALGAALFGWHRYCGNRKPVVSVGITE